MDGALCTGRILFDPESLAFGVVDEVAREQTGLASTADTLMRNVASVDELENANEGSAGAQHIISAGIRDVTEALTSDFSLNDLLRMVLETMHRGFGFSRTMIFVRDSRLNTMRARFGFGAEIERFIPLCDFPLAFAPDVFHIALQKSVDIVIENAEAHDIVRRIPEWFRQGINAKSFLLFTISLKSAAIGLLYADSERGNIKLDAEQLGSLRTLRSQVVLAFKHCTASGRL
jgi:transcriptional regulator with GAF, ATPase, and Fis domain